MDKNSRIIELFETVNTARILETLKQTDRAILSYRKVTTQFPSLSLGYRALARLYQSQGKFEQAFENFQKVITLERKKSVPAYVRNCKETSFPPCSTPILRHNLEQLEYLIEHGIVSARLRSRFDGQRRFLEKIQNDRKYDLPFPLAEKMLTILGREYYEPYNLYLPQASERPAINPNLDFRSLEKRFRENAGVLYFDDFLTPETLAALQRLSTESTIWYDAKPGGYIGTYQHHGFNCGLLYQIASELRKNLPGIIGSNPLTTMWGFKYDQNLEGIRVHADPAIVNVNFWVTPDSANRNPETGGMVVYPAAPPEDWKLDDYNGYEAQDKIYQFIKANKVPTDRIPYRQNRVVIFNSKYFHETDKYDFSEGYTNRRVNFTFLYGDPMSDPMFWTTNFWGMERYRS